MMVSSRAGELGLKFEESEQQIEMIFKSIGEVFLTYSEYRVCYFHDIGDYFDELGNLNQLVEKADLICQKELKQWPPEKHICASTIEELQKRLEDLAEMNVKIRSFDERRKRRAPVEIVGTLANALFGILSREDADKYNEWIDSTEKASRRNLKLITEQTSILESTVNLFNESSSDLKSRLNRLEGFFTDTLDKDRSNPFNKKWWAIQFNSIISLIITSLDRYEKTSLHILYIISNLMEGNLFPFITNKQILIDLEEINKNMTREEALPINPYTDSPFRLLRVANLQSTLASNRILTVLTIPILQNKLYKLIKVTPIPFGKEKVKIIQPSSDFFLTDEAHDESIPMTPEEFKDCSRLSQTKLICKQYEQISTQQERNCELTLMANPQEEEMFANCKIRDIPKQNYFIHLQDLNEYYCVIREPIRVQVICAENSHYVKLERDGFLTLDQNCLLKTKDFILKGHRTNNKIIRTSKYTFTRRGWTDEINIAPSKSISQNEFIKNPGEDYAKIAERLQELKEKEKEAEHTEKWSALHREGGLTKYLLVGILGVVLLLGAAVSCALNRKIQNIFKLEGKTNRDVGEQEPQEDRDFEGHDPMNDEVNRRRSK